MIVNHIKNVPKHDFIEKLKLWKDFLHANPKLEDNIYVDIIKECHAIEFEFERVNADPYPLLLRR